MTAGFHIGFKGRIEHKKGSVKNMCSALENPAPVDEYLQTELVAGELLQSMLRKYQEWWSMDSA